MSVGQLLVLTPRLTLQAQAQLLTGFGRYGPFYDAAPPGQGSLRFRDLQPTSGVSDPSFHTSALNVNLVARWEYRLGSTLFLAYSRSQEEPFPEEGVAASDALGPRALLDGPHTDTLLLKTSFMW